MLLHSEGDFANSKGVIFLCFVNKSHKNKDFVLIIEIIHVVLFQIVIYLAVLIASPQVKPLLKKTAIRHCVLSPINYELLIMNYAL